MNLWLIAATVLLFGLVPCAVVMLRGSIVEALVGLQMAGVLQTVVLLLLAQGFHRPPFFDLSLVLALLMLAGGLVFARMLERWV
ncbi:MAG TPA: monovalent cation/H+ antiporter complex subunit F [Acidimicrobiia bacterium]|nr:monovalent cation/H+ antiporter complex subunit F [Acidimicrobiia bacterium]